MPSARTTCIVLPRLGSPLGSMYRPVYAFIEEAARRRDMECRQVVYRGAGQLDENGAISGAVSLPKVADIAAGHLAEAPEATLICRSFGCMVPGYLYARRPELFRNVRRVVLWGPVPYHVMWQLFGDSAKIEARNEEATSKGARLAPGLFGTLEPLELLCQNLPSVAITVGVGSLDKYSSAAFGDFLSQIIRGAAPASVEVRVVADAPHEVHPGNVSPAVLAEYQSVLFGDVCPNLEE